MANIRVGEINLDIELIIFDKDGTLIDFNSLWGHRTLRSVNRMAGHIAGLNGNKKTQIQQALQSSMGFDPETGTVVSDGPLAMTSIQKMSTIAAVIAFQQGYTWPKAERLADEVFSAGLRAAPKMKDISPLGDVKGLFSQLRRSNVKIAIVTRDERSSTEAALGLLGVRDLVGCLVCGDDLGIPGKPMPQAVWRVSEHFDIYPEGIMVVGDNPSDMIMGARAGVYSRVGVLSGTGDPYELAAHADIVIESIDSIRVS